MYLMYFVLVALDAIEVLDVLYTRDAPAVLD
jgi:hypothetical protein